MVIYTWREDLRLSERYEGEMERGKGEKKRIFKFIKVEERKKNCAKFICPYRETAAATIPAIRF